MTDFIEVPANKCSIAKRKPVYGAGINDTSYITNRSRTSKEGLRKCPYYSRWLHMIERCYSSKFHDKNPTYKDCSVSKEWLLFSNFKNWMASQDWHGMELDKDIKVFRNKVYSPETCVFVDSKLNNLLSIHHRKSSELPAGVSWSEKRKKYQAYYTLKSKVISLGRFNTKEEAISAHRKAKALDIRGYKKLYPLLAESLETYASKLEKGEWNER